MLKSEKKSNLFARAVLLMCSALFSVSSYALPCSSANCGCVDDDSRQVLTDKGIGDVQKNSQIRQPEEATLSTNEADEDTNGSCSTYVNAVIKCSEYCNQLRVEHNVRWDVNAAASSQCNGASNNPCPADMENVIHVTNCTDGNVGCYERYIYFDNATKTKAYCYKSLGDNTTGCQ